MAEIGLSDPEHSEPNNFMVKLVLRNNIRQCVPYLNEQDDVVPSIVNQTELPATGLTDIEREALTIAAVEGKVTPKRLAEKAGVHSRTASRTLKQLAQQGLLHWHGSGPRDPKQYCSQDWHTLTCVCQSMPEYCGVNSESA